MVLWYAALSFALVLAVFGSPLIDYRLIMVGSLVPWLDYLWGPPWVLHSVFAPVAAMVLVMVAGWGRRLVQRRWLGVPIGMFLHLILAGGFTDQTIFWWPALGFDVDGSRPTVPSGAVAVVLEVIGLAVAVWLWRVVRLGRADSRARFIRTGHIDREVLRG